MRNIIICLLISVKVFGQTSEELADSAFWHSMAGNYDISLKLLDKAIEMNPFKVNYYNERGIVKKNMQQYNEAIVDYNTAIRLNPNIHNYYFNRAEANRLNSNFEDAVSDYTKAISLNKKEDIRCFFYRGVCKTLLEDINGALLDFNKAIELNHITDENLYSIESFKGSAYMCRGLLNLKHGKDKQAACLDLSKAGELGEKEAYDYIKKHCNN